MMKKTDANRLSNTDDAQAVRGTSGTDIHGEAGETDLHTGVKNQAASASAAEQQSAEHEDTVESLREKNASLEDTLLRAKADFVNAQRRNEKARLDAVQYANADLMRSVLGVLDDIERSLDAAGDTQDVKTVVEGVRLVYENLRKALRDHGLEAIDAIDQPFDPHVHEAIMQQPAADRAPNTVIEEVARGYRLKDRVIRPAKVVVSKAVESTLSTTRELDN